MAHHSSASGISSDGGAFHYAWRHAPRRKGSRFSKQSWNRSSRQAASGPLWRKPVFSPNICAIVVEIGEQAGRLDDVMSALAAHYEREDAISKNIKSAVTYPLVMIVMMLAVVLVLITKVMPIFEQVFEQLGTGLTGISRSVMGFGQVLNRYALVFIVIAVFIIVLLFYFSCTEKGRESLKNLAGRFFLTKGLSEKIAAARFASGMSLALSSGLDTDQSLEMVSRLTDHPVMQEKIKPPGTLSLRAQASPKHSHRQIFSPGFMRT